MSEIDDYRRKLEAEVEAARASMPRLDPPCVPDELRALADPNEGPDRRLAALMKLRLAAWADDDRRAWRADWLAALEKAAGSHVIAVSEAASSTLRNEMDGV